MDDFHFGPEHRIEACWGGITIALQAATPGFADAMSGMSETDALAYVLAIEKRDASVMKLRMPSIRIGASA